MTCQRSSIDLNFPSFVFPCPPLSTLILFSVTLNRVVPVAVLFWNARLFKLL